jgi:hypothetical protein
MLSRYSHRQVARLLAALWAVGFAGIASGQFEELAAKVPGSANAIVLLNAEELLASPLARREGWVKNYESAFASGSVAIPPDTRKLVLAAQIDFDHHHPLWELAVADFGQERTIAEVARATKGTIDPLAEQPSVALQRDAYVVQLEAKRLAVMSPANRQSIARWLREVVAKRASQLSPYLSGTLVASSDSQIVMALDLEDALAPDLVRAHVASSNALAGKKIDPDAAAKAISSVRGVVLEVAVTDGAFGRLMVHFDEDASALIPVAKPLLMEVLGNQGATIDDIDTWEVTTEPKRFVFHGPLSQEGRRRVFSLIDNPAVALVAPAGDGAAAPNNPQLSKEAQASQEYFATISKIRDDLREKSKDVKTFGQHALWLDNWARRIDRLPILNVDPELLAYGRYLTARMRDASASLKGIGINSAAREAQVYQQYSTSSYGYGGYYGGGYGYSAQWNNVEGQRRAIGAQERGKGATQAQQIAAEIENETVKIRQAMTQKYQINF